MPPLVPDRTLDALGSPGAAEARRFREQRRVLVADSPSLAGLDRVVATRFSSLEWTLALHFLTSPAKRQPIPAALSPVHIRIAAQGEADVEAPTVVSVEATGGTAEHAATVALVRVRFRAARQEELAERSGTFELALTGLASVDRFFSRASFRFGPPIAPSEADDSSAPIAQADGPPADYLARDYDSFRRLMLDTLGARVRGWTERNPADLGVTLVEALAYAGDYLSYFQDAIATEAYLQTARLRTSIRRHARLVDYTLDEGCNARVWVQIAASGEEPVPIRRGTQLLTDSGELPTQLVVGSWQHEQALGAGAAIFETMADAMLDPRLTRLELYNWGATEYTLVAGTTSAALAGGIEGIAAGTVLLLEEIAPLEGDGMGSVGSEGTSAATGLAAPGTARCHIVRLSEPGRIALDPATGVTYTLLHWFHGDALPFPLAVSRPGLDGAAVACARVSGNLLLADHGETVSELLPPIEEGHVYRPQLERFNLTFRAVPDPPALIGQPASVALVQSPAAILPAISLLELDPMCSITGELEMRPGATWFPRQDLLQSNRFSRDLVVEMSEERRAELRFGDGVHGRLPPAGARFEAFYRIGGGPSGNVGAGTIRHVVSDDPRILGARNPLPAQGGRAWEKLEKARVMVPTAFHTQQRCVTSDDFVATALLHPDVLAAAARLRWTGTWNTAFVYLQRRGGRPLDERFRRQIAEIFEGRLVAGVSLELRPPQWIALAIGLRVGIALHQDPGVVRNRLEDTFSDRRLPTGETGFFYPDEHTFGERVFAADLVARASAVAGVTSVVVETFTRRGEPTTVALERGYLDFDPLEIALLRNRPAMPQLGVLELRLEAAR